MVRITRTETAHKRLHWSGTVAYHNFSGHAYPSSAEWTAYSVDFFKGIFGIKPGNLQDSQDPQTH